MSILNKKSYYYTVCCAKLNQGTGGLPLIFPLSYIPLPLIFRSNSLVPKFVSVSSSSSSSSSASSSDLYRGQVSYRIISQIVLVIYRDIYPGLCVGGPHGDSRGPQG